MADETRDTMNLDLNLGPLLPPPYVEPGSGSLSGGSVTLDAWIQEPVHRFREAVRITGARQRWRRRQGIRDISVDLMVNPVGDGGRGGSGGGGGNELQPGEGSITAEERTNEATKAFENNTNDLESDAVGKKEDVEKDSGDKESFFDCNICLDLARDPVLTSCGHLYCWPCLYRWLHVDVTVKECPMCKGEVTDENVIPIYGRGNNTHKPDEDPSFKVPLRPDARRVESLRQTIHRTPFAFPMEEMIRRINSRFDLNRESIPPRDPVGGGDSTPERNNSMLNRMLTSRGIRREQSQSVVAPDDLVDLTHNSPTSFEEGPQLRSLLLRRSQSHRAGSISSLSSALRSAERLVEAYFRNQHIVRNQEQSSLVDDRDSVSSIAAVIHSESQTVDTAMEIDSMVSLSTSSSRRRNDASRVSDVDSGDSRAPRRRRLN